MSEQSQDPKPEGDLSIEQRTKACEVLAEHLASLDPIHKLLRAMNDPFEAANRIAPLVDEIPVLVARCERQLLRKSPYAEWKSTAHLLSLIGNRGLESVLLSLLEDLTTLKMDLAEQEAENNSAG
jgi:hypothetical protein